MATPKQINATKIVFKKGSFEWLIHFGIPIGLFSLGALGTVTFFSQVASRSYVNNIYFEFYLPVLLVGIFTYQLQAKKLKLKFLDSVTDINESRDMIRMSVLEAGWKIKYDNKHVLIASADGWFCDELLILKYKTNIIYWTAINDPDNHNSIASQMCSMTKAKKLITKIKNRHNANV